MIYQNYPRFLCKTRGCWVWIAALPPLLTSLLLTWISQGSFLVKQFFFFFCCLYSCSNFIASIYSSNFFSAVFIILCFCSTPENGQSGSILNMSPRLSSYFNTVSTFDIFACLILAHQMLVKYYSHLFLEFFISLTLLNKFTLLGGVLRGSSVFPSFSSGSVCGNV